MKQNININQLNELSSKGKKRLRKWWEPSQGDFHVFNWNLDSRKPKDYGLDMVHDCGSVEARRENDDDSLPLLSIGQMIEFLYDNNIQIVFTSNDTAQVSTAPNGHFSLAYFDQSNPSPKLNENTRNEVVDLFWEAVKEVLEKK